jgi:site-specific DNA recombinase
MLDPKPLAQKVAIYARVSTEEQREGQTIDSQIAELETFARERKWSVVDIYKDEGWSGSLLARPALDRLRDDAAAGKFSLVLLNDVDRLARDVSHFGVLKRFLERCGVEIVFRKIPSGQSPTNNLMVNILASFAEFEREMIADRTRRGRRHKVEVRQQFLGSKAPYGYRYTPKDKVTGTEGRLQIAEEEACVVKQMYGWVDQERLSARRVAARLNESGIRPRNGRTWAKSTVLRILRSEVYAGTWYYCKHYSCEPLRPSSNKAYRKSEKSSTRLRSRDEWLPVVLPSTLRIIDRNLWDRVQAQLTRNISFAPRNTKHLYLLRGLVRCGGCRGTYVGDPNHGRFYYRCHRRCKDRPTIREEELDKIVWTEIARALLNPSIVIDQMENLRRKSTHQAKGISDERSVIDLALKQVSTEESRILGAYRLGKLSPIQLGKELEALNTRKISLTLRKEDINQSKIEAFPDVGRTVHQYCAEISQRLNSFNEQERQQLLRLLIDTITVEENQVRIRAVIPITESPGPDRTWTTAIAQRGRNSVSRERRVSFLKFELTPRLPSKPFSVMSPPGLALLRRLTGKPQRTTLRELQAKVERERGLRISVSSLSRAINRLRLVASQTPSQRVDETDDLEVSERAA